MMQRIENKINPSSSTYDNRSQAQLGPEASDAEIQQVAESCTSIDELSDNFLPYPLVSYLNPRDVEVITLQSYEPMEFQRACERMVREIAREHEFHFAEIEGRPEYRGQKKEASLIAVTFWQSRKGDSFTMKVPLYLCRDNHSAVRSELFLEIQNGFRGVQVCRAHQGPFSPWQMTPLQQRNKRMKIVRDIAYEYYMAHRQRIMDGMYGPRNPASYQATPLTRARPGTLPAADRYPPVRQVRRPPEGQRGQPTTEETDQRATGPTKMLKPSWRFTMRGHGDQVTEKVTPKLKSRGIKLLKPGRMQGQQQYQDSQDGVLPRKDKTAPEFPPRGPSNTTRIPLRITTDLPRPTIPRPPPDMH